ncbi:MAG: DMT family transporter [Candidatus Ornithomonoglobus sp.]
MKSKFSKENIGALEVFAGGAIWGTIGLFIVQLNNCGADSALISFLRMTFAFLIMLVITITKFGIKALKVDFATLVSCALLGLVCHGIYNVFYSLAVVKTGVAISAVLLNIAPVFTAVTSVILFSEKITVKKGIALAVNVFGCIIAVTGGKLSLEGMSAIGILFGALAGFCYSLTAIFGRIVGNKTHTFVMSTYSYLFAAAFLAVSLKPMGASFDLNTGMLVWGFLYALIPTTIAYIFYYNGVRKITESSRVPVYASAETVVAVILGVLVCGERLGTVNVTGIALVIASIIFMNTAKKNRVSQ